MCLPSTEERVKEQVKRLIAEFGDYSNTVTLISSLDNWFDHHWGATTLIEFDRFPDLDGLTPDFCVSFSTPYVLIGEVMKTFRTGAGSQADLQQVIRYSHWRRPPAEGAPAHHFDVLLLVAWPSTDAACDAIAGTDEDPNPQNRPGASIVVLGHSLEPRTNKEYYVLKWFDFAGNSRFSSPNACPPDRGEDLNALLIDTETHHHAIRVDQEALDVHSRNPFINDQPPALYSLIQVLWPAVNTLLTEDERDELYHTKKLQKEIGLSQLVSAPMMQQANVRKKYLKQALEFLIECEVATRVDSDEEERYRVSFERAGDPLDYFAEKRARQIVRGTKRKKKRPVGARPSAGTSEDQRSLF